MLIGAGTFNSAALASFPAIGATQHAIIVLDPTASAGAPEIAIITAHTGAATSATITRGAEVTSPRQHLSGTTWRHINSYYDYLQIVANAAALPATNIYQGMLAYQQDLDKYVGRSSAGIWQDLVAMGAWTTWSPTLTNLSLGNGTLIAKYWRSGRTVGVRLRFTLGSTSTVGTQPTFSLPVNGAADYVSEWVIGNATLIDNGVKAWSGYVQMTGANSALIRADDGAGAFTTVTATVPFTWATGDYFMLTATYEAAA